MRTIRFLTCAALSVVLLAALPVGAAAKRPPLPKAVPFTIVDVPWTDDDPVMDGAATSFQEWSDGEVMPDLFAVGKEKRAGWYWFERKDDWTATSVQTQAQSPIPGMTVFVAHDITGSADRRNVLHSFRVQEASDWNSFTFPRTGGDVKIWVLANANEPDDRTWLDGAEGLAESPIASGAGGNDRIDDRGFIVRLGDDPSTDRQWLPGMPEPGDQGWDPEEFYGCFGRATFGTSFQDAGLDRLPEDDFPHEVYEFCCTMPSPFLDPPPPPPPQSCIWWEEVIVKIDDRLVRFWVLKGDFWLHFWLPPPFIPIGPPPPRTRSLIWHEALAEKAQQTQQSDPSLSQAYWGAASSFFDVFQSFGENDARGVFEHAHETLDALAGVADAGDPETAREMGMHVLAMAQSKSIEIVRLELFGPSTWSRERLLPAKRADKAFGLLVKAGALMRKILEADGDPDAGADYHRALEAYRKVFNALTGGAAN